MPLWLLRPPNKAVHLHPAPAPQLHGQDFGPTVGQNRPASRGAARELRPDVEQAARRTQRGNQGESYQSARHPAAPLQEPPRRALQRQDDNSFAPQVRRTRRRRHGKVARSHHQDEHEREGLRSHPESRPHNRRPRRQRPSPPAPHHGSHRLPQPG